MVVRCGRVVLTCRIEERQSKYLSEARLHGIRSRRNDSEDISESDDNSRRYRVDDRRERERERDIVRQHDRDLDQERERDSAQELERRRDLEPKSNSEEYNETFGVVHDAAMRATEDEIFGRTTDRLYGNADHIAQSDEKRSGARHKQSIAERTIPGNAASQGSYDMRPQFSSIGSRFRQTTSYSALGGAGLATVLQSRNARRGDGDARRDRDRDRSRSIPRTARTSETIALKELGLLAYAADGAHNTLAVGETMDGTVPSSTRISYKDNYSYSSSSSGGGSMGSMRDGYSGRPRRTSDLGSVAPLPLRSRPAIVQETIARPNSPLSYGYDYDHRRGDGYIKSNTSVRRSEPKTAYSIDPGSAKGWSGIEYDKRQPKRERMSYHRTKPSLTRPDGASPTEIMASEWSYIDSAGMYETTEPMRRRYQRRGSVDGRRPWSVVESRVSYERGSREYGPPPTVRHLSSGKEYSRRYDEEHHYEERLPRQPTRQMGNEDVASRRFGLRAPSLARPRSRLDGHLGKDGKNTVDDPAQPDGGSLSASKVEEGKIASPTLSTEKSQPDGPSTALLTSLVNTDDKMTLQFQESSAFEAHDAVDTTTETSSSDDEYDSGSTGDHDQDVDTRSTLLERLMTDFRETYFAALGSWLSHEHIRTHQGGQSSTNAVESSHHNTNTTVHDRSGATQKHKRGSDDCDHDEDDGSPNQRKKPYKSDSKSNVLPMRKLACPFFKRKPQTYMLWKSCPGPGWDSVHRLKYESEHKSLLRSMADSRQRASVSVPYAPNHVS